MLMLQCRIWQVLFVTLLQALLWVHLHLFSFSEEIYTLRSWHLLEFSQQAAQTVWKLQCWAEVSASSEQICCGTEGCPDTATGADVQCSVLLLQNPWWCVLHSRPDASGGTLQILAALHSPQAVPATCLALLQCLYLTNLPIHPQLLLPRNVLPRHWGDDTGCAPPSANDANLIQHRAGSWALPQSEQ